MRSIMLKLWLTITLTNLVIFGLLGISLAKLVHDFHFGLRAEDLRSIGNETNIIYGTSGRDAALKYASAMATHTSAIIVITNNNGNIITTTDKTLFNKNNVFSPNELNALAKRKYFVEVEPNNIYRQDMIIVIIPSFSKNFSTAVFAPVEPITTTINRLWTLMFSTGIIIIFIMAVISYLISRRISFPLLKINKEALKIAQGEFDNLDIPKSKDEIGQLGETIQHVAQNMKITLAERERLSQIQKDFVANVSHDLRTPLSLIQGYALALQHGVAEGEEKGNAVQIIIEESQRMDRLTNELLDLAKLEAGKQAFNFSLLDLAELTNKILENYSSVAANKNVAMNLIIKSNKKISADADRISQVIINLLNNAINHTPTGGKITIKLSGEDNNAVFSVHNTGSWISPEDINYIWERFYKAEKSRTRSIKGTGLGLAIVKGIVEAHGGEVGVESSPETGTTFWFSLSAC